MLDLTRCKEIYCYFKRVAAEIKNGIKRVALAKQIV